jgi:hypothetical protein
MRCVKSSRDFHVILDLVLQQVVKKKNSPTTRNRGAGERGKYSSYSFLPLGTGWGECSASRPSRAISPGARTPGTHWTGGWESPKAGLDTQGTVKFREKWFKDCEANFLT